MNHTAKAHLALLTANIIYAASFTITKFITPEHIQPFGLVLLRSLGATPLYWLAGTVVIREKAERRDIPKLIFIGLFGVVINQLLFIKGLSLTSPISASIMMITSPILVLVIAGMVIREKITTR